MKTTVMKRILKVATSVVIAISVVLGILIFFPLWSAREPRTPKSIKEHFNLTLPAQAQVLDHQWYDPPGSFGYYGVVRILRENMGMFLAQPGLLPYPSSQEGGERKLILNEWGDVNFWEYRAISHIRHSIIASNGVSEVFVDLDDPKFAIIYLMNME